MKKEKRIKKSEQLEVVGQLRCNICGELHTVQKNVDRRYRFRYIMGCPKGRCGVVFTQDAFDYATQHRDYHRIDSTLCPKPPSVTLTTGSEGRNSK
jgi:hypothetical protein